MKKKWIMVISLFIILLLILIGYKVRKKDKTISEKAIITSIANFEETKIEEIKGKNNTLKPTEISYTINEIPVTKMDIQMEEKKLNAYSEEEKKIVKKKDIMKQRKNFMKIVIKQFPKNSLQKSGLLDKKEMSWQAYSWQIL